jgi:2-keto-4-pentenoate hydratase/2-oxohepta-3-ene-1,7-dioic acid hydratase in catechol pathway
MFDKILCVGKNYLKHAMELGDAVPEQPVYFIKPPSTLLTATGENQSFKIPAAHEVHHEVELVFRIEDDDHGNLRLSHFTIGLDLTLRDLQAHLKKAGQPWEKAKVFKNSAIVGPWEQVTSLDAILALPFELQVNGEPRQKGQGRDMRWKPDEILADLQKWFPMKSGDLLFTGTPEGVGPIRTGDLITVRAHDDHFNIHYELRCES